MHKTKTGTELQFLQNIFWEKIKSEKKHLDQKCKSERQIFT